MSAAILDPGIPIIDSHHHLTDKVDDFLAKVFGTRRYLIDDYLEQVLTGHHVIGSVAMESHAMYRADGPPELAPVGESEFFNGQAAMAASGSYGPCRVAAGFVTFADLEIGSAVEDVLTAHLEAAPRRFRGIRDSGFWDPALDGMVRRSKGYYRETKFREGFAKLAPLDLTFDAFVLSTQLDDLIDLAQRFAETTIILDHMGTPIGIGEHAGRLAQEYPQWRQDMRSLARCDNVVVKLGGLGTFISALPSFHANPPAAAETLAAEYRPYVEATIELFGASRCMFESNLPTDQVGSFSNICNAYKLLTKHCSRDEKIQIFAGTANEIYRLGFDLTDTIPSTNSSPGLI